MLIGLLVLNNNLVILVRINLALLTHSLKLLTTPARLLAKMLVVLRLKDAEFVHFCLCRHSQTTIALCTIMQTCPEIRELVYHFCIVGNSCPQIACTVKQSGTIEQSHHVIWLKGKHIVEILYGIIVIAYLLTQETAVIVCKEIVRLNIEGEVIVGHRTTEIIQTQTSHGTVYVVASLLRLQVNSLGKKLVGILPFIP